MIKINNSRGDLSGISAKKTSLQMISYSPSEGCILSTLIVHTLWHQIFSRCYAISLLNVITLISYVSITTGGFVFEIKRCYFLDTSIQE